MKKKCFLGVAVHPRQVDPAIATMVGVWIGRRFSSQQRSEIMNLGRNRTHGRVGVRIGRTCTSVMCLKRVSDAEAARKLTASLVISVAQVTGVTSILRQLPNYRAVRRALIT